MPQVTLAALMSAELEFAKALGHKPLVSVSRLDIPDGEGTTTLPSWARNPASAMELQVQYGIQLETARPDGKVFARVSNGQFYKLGKPKHFTVEVALADYPEPDARHVYESLPTELRAAMHAVVLAATAKRTLMNAAVAVQQGLGDFPAMTPQVRKTRIRGVTLE